MLNQYVKIKSNIDYAYMVRTTDFEKMDFENNVKYVSEKAYNFLQKSKLFGGEILINKIGNPGQMFLMPKLDIPMTLGMNLFMVRLKNNSILNNYYVYIFFNTKIGKNIIYRKINGAVPLTIDKKAINSLPVPIFSNTFQSQIENLVRTSYDKLKESKKLYKEAEDLLLEELGLKDYQPSDKNIAIKSFSQSFGVSGRLDSEYYQPKYDEILEKIKSYKGGWDYIANIVDWQKGVEVGSEAYQEAGKGFLRVSDFSKFGIENISKKISNELYEELKDNFKPQVGDILFTKDGTIGLSYVVKENLEAIISGAFLRLTLQEKYKNFSKETLVLIFNSIVSKMQVEQLSGGAIIAHLKPSDFENFVIPIIDNKIQEKIEQKIQVSFQLKKESKELLDLAVKAVEIAIEKDENKAMEFIDE